MYGRASGHRVWWRVRERTNVTLKAWRLRGWSWPCSVVLALVLALAAADASAAATRSSRPVARLVLDTPSLRTGDVLRIDLRHSKLPKGRVTMRLAFGDDMRVARPRRPRVISHRYRKAGRFTIRLTLRAHGRVSRASGVVVVRRRTVRAVPAPGTVVRPTSQVSSLTGDPATQQNVVLRTGSGAPSVGGVLVVPSSAQDPDGVLGQVAGVQPLADGTTSVQLAPTTLEDAYSQVNVSTGGSLSDPGVLLEDDEGH